MATADKLSTQTQQAVIDSLPAQHKANAGNAVKRALWTAGGVAAFAATAAFAPAGLATIGFIVGATVAAYNGFKLLGAASRGLSLLGIKNGVKDDKFVPNLKAKAGKALQRSARLNNISNKAFWITVGAIVAAAVPPLAPIAAIVHPIALSVMLGSWAAADWTQGTAQATLPTAKLVYDRQVAEGAIRPAEDILPPGASVQRAPQHEKGWMQSLKDTFKAKTGKDAQKKLAPQPQAPKLAPPAP